MPFFYANFVDICSWTNLKYNPALGMAANYPGALGRGVVPRARMQPPGCITPKIKIMMNKNTVLAWATWIMIAVGIGLIALGAFRYEDIAGWGFAAVGIGFFAIAWVFNALKGRV